MVLLFKSGKDKISKHETVKNLTKTEMRNTNRMTMFIQNGDYNSVS